MFTAIRFLENVNRISDGATVRPLLVSVEFTYGHALLQEMDYLQLHELADGQPIEVDIAGLDRALVAQQKPPLPVLNYHIVLTPKSGRSWGTIRGANDVDFDVAVTP